MAVREVTAAMLRDLGYQVLEAGSGGAALDLLQREPAIDLLLVDFAMPGMSGADVARVRIEPRPALPAVFITGYADHRALRRGQREPHHRQALPAPRTCPQGSCRAGRSRTGAATGWRNPGGAATQMQRIAARIDRLNPGAAGGTSRRPLDPPPLIA